MSNETETQMEVDENGTDEQKQLEDTVNEDKDCVLIDDDKSKSMPGTPNCDKRTSGLNKSLLSSAEKIDKNLKLQIKIENAKKRQEEKEKRDKEKKEREEARIKREDEWRRKREEEEKAKQKRHEEREREKEKKAAELAEKEKIKQEALKKREEEKRLRDEEKRQKEEERKQKEEEKRKKEEEKQREEEEKRLKEEKVKSKFTSFFIKKETPASEKIEDAKNLRFMPFQLKENMTCAPICRRDDLVNMSSEQREEFLNDLDKILHGEKNVDELNYIKEIRTNPRLIRKREIRCRRKTHTKLIDESSNDEIKVLATDTNNETKFKIKYLHFDRKVYKRPPYYGTWRKKSNKIGPRRPFAKDEKIFDYEFDSDDEWEEEPEGESICDSEKDEDEEVIDEDDDDGFFVPHGHLSDDELDEEEKTIDPELKIARETTKREQWELERKKSSKFLIPKCFIVPNYWKSNNNYEKDSKVVDEIKLFERLKYVLLANQIPINFNDQKTEDSQKTVKGSKNQIEASPSTTKSSKANKSKNHLNPPPSPMNPNATLNQTPASPSNTTPSIIKFISKMSKKDVICKLEPLHGTQTGINNVAPLSPLPSKITANFATPGTPNSPKMTPTSSTAEKRVCSSNGENAVKRLKLDENQSVTNEQKHPTTPNTIINMFKSSGSCKKSLKMTKIENTEMDCETSKTASPSKKLDLDESGKKGNKENAIITID